MTQSKQFPDQFVNKPYGVYCMPGAATDLANYASYLRILVCRRVLVDFDSGNKVLTADVTVLADADTDPNPVGWREVDVPVDAVGAPTTPPQPGHCCLA